MKFMSNLIFLGRPCPVLAAPGNGSIISHTGAGTQGSPVYQDVANMQCNAGYVLSGSSSRTCNALGAWDGTTTTCDRMYHYCFYYKLGKCM